MIKQTSKQKEKEKPAMKFLLKTVEIQIIHNQSNFKPKLHPYFQQFNLNLSYFDINGDKFYQIPFTHKEQKRGGWPYYPPCMGQRFGLNVAGRYDNQADRWLESNGKQGQWAVAYHAVRCPKAIGSEGKSILNLIMDGIQSGQMLKAGPGQAYESTIAKNRSNEKVGKGICLTPHIQSCFYFINNQDEYGLIFQCRVNPKQIKVCNNEIFLILNESKNIRPYGIILIETKKLKDYPKTEEQFGKQFRYEDYKESIEKHNKFY